MPVYAQNDDFGGIGDFPRVRKSTLGTTFSAKKATTKGEGFPGEPAQNQPGRNLRSKTARGSIFIDLVCILVDLGAIFDGFWIDFASILVSISRQLCIDIFFPQTHEPTSSIHNPPQTHERKAWPVGMRARALNVKCIHEAL